VRVPVLPEASAFQSAASPLRVAARAPPGDFSAPAAITFMGRVLDALLALTAPARGAAYGPGPSGGAWFDGAGRELCGPGVFSALNDALGVVGLAGLDRLLGHTAAQAVRALLRAFAAELAAGAGEVLARLADELAPESGGAAPALSRSLEALAAKLRKPLLATVDRCVALGRAQLLRRAVVHEVSGRWGGGAVPPERA
jgi:hypothetical protein